jgi:signal transduction histidine kinase
VYNFYFFVTVIAGIANLTLGLLVLLRNKKDQINWTFFIMIIFVCLWLLANFFVDFMSPEVAFFLLRLTEVFGAWATFLFLYFVSIFPNNFGGKRAFLIRTYGILPLLFTPLMFTNLVIVGIEKNSNVYTPTLGIMGNVFFLVYLPVTILISIGILAYKLFKSRGSSRVQLKFVTLGFVLTTVLALIFSVILPVFSNSAETARFAPLTTIFFIGFTSYAIVKHHLMDIRFVVARSLAYLILLATLAGFYAGSVLGLERLFLPAEFRGFSIAQAIIQTSIAVVMVFLFQPLRKIITKATDKIFFKNAYDPEVFLDTMSHTIGGSIVLIELLYKTLNLITSEMKITRGQIVVLTDTGKIYTSQSMGYDAAPKLDEEELHKMVKDGILVYDELEETSRFKHLLRKLNASVVVPLKTENDTEGLLILGEKLSGDMYSAGDLRVFETIAPELAVAINNAKSFEKIEKFNVTLREEVKKATAELEKKNTQLMELDKAKDEFISMASHQLRTPLTAIKGYLSMLLEGDAGEIRVSQYDFVNEAFNGANRMVGLINDLLNVSRMETGRFFLEPVEIDVSKMVAEEVKQLQQHAKEKKLYLKFEEKGKTPHIWADETKMRQVVMNFIDNAVYYTTEGGVTVRLSHDAHDVVFEVVDTGIGVPKAQQKQLFTKFYRADNARHVRPDGTGLGIYLAKRVLDDHKADLIFKSEEGKGSTFGFKFPIKSKLSTKQVSAPAPANANATDAPAVGELAAGIGVDPKAIEATSGAGLEKPLSDSADAGELSKQAVKMSKAATKGGGNSSMPADVVKSAEEAIETMRQSEIKKEESASKTR